MKQPCRVVEAGGLKMSYCKWKVEMFQKKKWVKEEVEGLKKSSQVRKMEILNMEGVKGEEVELKMNS